MPASPGYFVARSAKRGHFVPLIAMLAASLACSPLAMPALNHALATRPGTTSAPAATTRLKIISNLPMTGASLADTQVIVNAEKLRLDQAHDQACGGRYSIDFESWDDSSMARDDWDPAVEAANAHKAAADPAVVAVLGPYNSDAAKLSIPILNQAGGLVMISPSNTYPGLTKTGLGAAGEPNLYYPSGARNYARVVNTDEVQGAMAAHFLHDWLQVQTVFVLDDSEAYGQSTAAAFAAAAQQVGLKVVGRASFHPADGTFIKLMGQIARSNAGHPPDALYAGMLYDDHSGQFLRDKAAVLGDNNQVKLIGPDGIQFSRLITDAGAQASAGLYATLNGLPIGEMPPAGQAFYAAYARAYGPTHNPYAVYGYEAMSVALQAIEAVCSAHGDPTNRAAVRGAVFSLKNVDDALGHWSFDANGDTSLTDMTFYQVIDGKFQIVAVIRATQIKVV